MGELVPFTTLVDRKSPSPNHQAGTISYDTYAVYQQAQTMFRALYSGRPISAISLEDGPLGKIVRRHWAAVERLAGGLLKQKTLSRDQALKLLDGTAAMRQRAARHQQR